MKFAVSFSDSPFYRFIPAKLSVNGKKDLKEEDHFVTIEFGELAEGRVKQTRKAETESAMAGILL